MNSFLRPTTDSSRDTDYGREIHGETVSLAEALRRRAGRMAQAEAFRYQLAMALMGFFGGLILVIPTVLWLAPPRPIGSGATAAPSSPATFAEASVSGARRAPSLSSMPTIANRAASSESTMPVPEPERAEALGNLTTRQLDAARGLIRAGEILAARRLLEKPELADSGEAHFMLAESYDPNVLAALGATGVHAEAHTARRHYEAALEAGVSAAAARLEALE